MSRNQQKGTAFETAIAAYMSEWLGVEVVRRARSGAKDRGDLHGLKTPGGRRIVAELKNHSRLDLAGWVQEAETEARHDMADVAVVIHKRRGKGTKQLGESYVTMTLDNLLELLAGDDQ